MHLSILSVSTYANLTIKQHRQQLSLPSCTN